MRRRTEKGTTVPSEQRRTPSDRCVARRVFPPTPEAASEARRYTSDVLRVWGVMVADDAVLIAAELATNAVRHAKSAFVLSLRMEGNRLRVAVRDCDPAAPRFLEQTTGATGGRGLLIVRRLASSWGWEPTQAGKVIWATLQMPGSAYPATCVPPAIA